MKDLIIVGAGNGDIIKLIEDINAEKPTWNIIGFTERDENLIGKERFGYPVLGKDEEIIPKYPNAWLAVNVSKSPKARYDAIQNVLTYTKKIATLIHPSVNIKFVQVGLGVIIHEGVRFGYNADLNDYIVIHFNSTIGHDTKIGSYSIVNPGAIISGRVSIGEGVLIGAGTRIIQEINIGDWSIIGIGATVTQHVEKNVTYISYTKNIKIKRR